jgi:hypothetical protein
MRKIFFSFYPCRERFVSGQFGWPFISVLSFLLIEGGRGGRETAQRLHKENENRIKKNENNKQRSSMII